jgi:hypothetical protein
MGGEREGWVGRKNDRKSRKMDGNGEGWVWENGGAGGTEEDG